MIASRSADIYVRIKLVKRKHSKVKARREIINAKTSVAGSNTENLFAGGFSQIPNRLRLSTPDFYLALDFRQTGQCRSPHYCKPDSPRVAVDFQVSPETSSIAACLSVSGVARSPTCRFSISMIIWGVPEDLTFLPQRLKNYFSPPLHDVCISASQ